MSPLATAIYAILRNRVPARWQDAMITYGDLCIALTPHGYSVGPRSHRLWDALGEIVVWCRTETPPLEPLPAIVVRKDWSAPGMAYYSIAHPRIAMDDTPQQMIAWGRAAQAVCITRYP